jgi:hypothetical protein
MASKKEVPVMPMIRVDDEVYEYLNQRGRTEDSFNDVIRRELGLSPKTQTARQGSKTDGPRSMAAAPASKLSEALDRHLPPHWSETPERRAQILEVATVFLRTDKSWPAADRLGHAAEHVAKDHDIEINTVKDKYGRQLYGTGTGQQTERFRLALEAVEKDLRSAGRGHHD